MKVTKELIEDMRHRSEMHDSHPADFAQCTQEMSLADYRAILATLDAAYAYAEAAAKPDGTALIEHVRLQANLLATISLEGQEVEDSNE